MRTNETPLLTVDNVLPRVDDVLLEVDDVVVAGATDSTTVGPLS